MRSCIPCLDHTKNMVCFANDTFCHFLNKELQFREIFFQISQNCPSFHVYEKRLLVAAVG